MFLYTPISLTFGYNGHSQLKLSWKIMGLRGGCLTPGSANEGALSDTDRPSEIWQALIALRQLYNHQMQYVKAPTAGQYRPACLLTTHWTAWQKADF